MLKRSEVYSPQLKYQILYEYENDDYTIKELCKKHGISDRTFYDWKIKYERYGLEGLENSKAKRIYSAKMKVMAVEDYLSGKGSLTEIIYKYDISSRSVLSRWIKKYNSHSILEDTRKGEKYSMTKGRKTTLKERIEIVQSALANNKNYHEVSQNYQVSYQQVYQWVRKYEKGGWESLKDRRGHKKDQTELTADDKMKLKLRKIEKENEHLRAENAFLKKLKEVERRCD